MNCSILRDRLTSGQAVTAELRRHLAGCPRCRQFAEGLEAVRSEARGHFLAVEPDASFAARVVQRLPDRRQEPAADLLGWAALRLLPATVILALLLSGWSLASSPSPEELLGGGEQDVLAWILGEEAAS